MKIYEIDYKPGGNPVDQVAQGSAQEQGRAQTGFGAFPADMIPQQENSHQGHQGYDHEKQPFVFQQPKGSAGIQHIGTTYQTRDHRETHARFHGLGNQQFGNPVQQDHTRNQGQHKNQSAPFRQFGYKKRKSPTMPYQFRVLNLPKQVGALPVVSNVPSKGHIINGRSSRAPL